MNCVCPRGLPARVRRWLVLGSMPLALVLAPAGCGEDPVVRAIQDASTKMSLLSPGAAPAPEKNREETYNEVIEELQVVLREGQPGQQAAANMLISEARSGLAQAPLAELERAERKAYDAAQEIRAALSAWIQHTSRQAAAETYDPQPEFDSIDEQVQQRERALEAARAHQRELETQARALRDEAEAIRAEAKETRLAESRLGERMLELPAQQAATLTDELRTLQRRAGDAEARAAFLDVRASQIQREAKGAALEVDRLKRQIRLLAAAREEVSTRAENARRDAAQAAQDAAAVAAEIDELITQLERQRDTVVTPAAERVLDLLRSAVSAATSARSYGPSRMAAQVLAGSMQQTIGDFHFAVSRARKGWVTLLDDLASAAPPLPNRDRYAAMRDDVQAKMEASRQAACEAYASAKSSYEGAPVRDQTVSSRIERLSGLLDRLCPSADPESQQSAGEADEG